jgi:hypothetical protein
LRPGHAETGKAPRQQHYSSDHKGALIQKSLLFAQKALFLLVKFYLNINFRANTLLAAVNFEGCLPRLNPPQGWVFSITAYSIG